jgi:hypothetical protein
MALVEPGLTLAQDVRAVLLGGVCGLFLRVIRCRLKKRRPKKFRVSLITFRMNHAQNKKNNRYTRRGPEF